MSSLEKNTAVVRGLHELWNTGDVARIPVIAGLLSTRTAFPHWHEDVVDMVAEGDRVVTRYVSTGTHRGDFWRLAPTGIRGWRRPRSSRPPCARAPR